MKRFLAIAAASLCIAACSQTGVLEPTTGHSMPNIKPGRDQRIAQAVRVNAPRGTFPRGEKWRGQPLDHKWTNDGTLTIRCVVVLGTCYEVGSDGSYVDIHYRPLIAIDSSMPSIDRTLGLIE